MTHTEHVPWDTSDRASRLPPDWTELTKLTSDRAHGRCEGITYPGLPTHSERCDGTGSECDHITAGDDHAPTNLAWLNTHCHALKSSAEGVAARRARSQRPRRRHPGRPA